MPENPVIERITRHLRPIKDITLLLLRSQLIVEEQINETLRGILPNAPALEVGNLTSFQRIQIARALNMNKKAEEALEFAERLNVIRNKLAHQLEPIGVEDAVSSFVKDVAAAIPLNFESEVPLNIRVGMCVGYICGVLYAFRRATNVVCAQAER